MEAGGKDCEEETLQTAFKKLRVDAESVPGAVCVSEAPRASRAPLDLSGAKPKLSCPKDNWHGCMRKSSRGASRTQRRRRSKSPILHPPKFTYCSAAAVSPPSGCLKQQRLAVPDPAEPRPPGEGITASSAAQKELSSSGSSGPISPLVFGSCAGFEAPETSGESSEEEKSASEAARRVSGPADFRALSEGHGSSAEVPCSCAWKEGGIAAESQCQCRDPSRGWQGVEVYSFTGLRNATSECERTIGTGTAAASSSGSPRSCSEQARAYVDDITIEDLSGYMEYYLYIPKKMSHMAEMMYT
ncbi:hypothetical protein PBY51_013805 [Eleginops maclovinus]|uniref:Oxidative stress-responsive serine-rich protein 1 n=1 Tax=Eleginops maclovinus TaxID=56733 RepID=A0AAN7XZZ6_ELEMC|nr:hypothetical protein PBY51_013805 [Eleginops maclovinus]